MSSVQSTLYFVGLVLNIEPADLAFGRIEADASVKEGDPRRIVQLVRTVVNQPVHINLHGGAGVAAA